MRSDGEVTIVVDSQFEILGFSSGKVRGSRSPKISHWRLKCFGSWQSWWWLDVWFCLIRSLVMWIIGTAAATLFISSKFTVLKAAITISHYHIHKTCMCIRYIQIIWFVNINPYTHRHSLPIPTITIVHIRGVTGSIYFKDSRPRTGEVGEDQRLSTRIV